MNYASSKYLCRILASILLSAAGVMAPSAGAAVTTTLSAMDSGFYNMAGRHSKLDGSPDFGMATSATFNYSLGAIDEVAPFPPDPEVPRKNYFTFALGGIVPGTITSATLKLFLPPTGYSGGEAELFGLYGSLVTVPGMGTLAGDLLGVHSPFVPEELAKAKSLFVEIAGMKTAGMPPLGTKVITAADAGTMVTIPFTPLGVAYLNAYAGGPVVLGGVLETLDLAGPPPDAVDEYVFGFTSPVIPGGVPWDMSGVSPTPIPMLEFTAVPESASACVVFALLAGSVAIAKRLGRRLA